MFKHFRVLLCVCGLLSALAGPANAVSYTIDSGGGAAPVYSSLENLRSALAGMLGNNDSITFLNSDATLTGEFTLAGGFALTLDNGAAGAPLTIIANAGSTTRFLNAAGTATITWGSGLTFSGFNAGALNSGGAVFVGGDLTGGIVNSTFTGNTAGLVGGAVAVAGALNGGISGSTFTSNTATNSSGGAVFVFGSLSGGIVNSTFTSNTATFDSGGAVYMNGSLTDGIINSTFTANTAGASGGAVYMNGSLTDGIINSTFTSNTAGVSGGALYVGGALSGGIVNSTFEGNTATNGAGGAVFVAGALNGGIVNSTFTSNTTGGSGGAVFVGGALSGGISGSSFSSNTATNGFGGAVFVGALSGGIANSTFEGNTAGISGGAVSVGGDLTGGISGSTFEDNAAGESGGALYVNGDLTGGISGSSFTSNTATWGGALYLGGNADISGADARFTNNTAAYDPANTGSGLGGAIFHNGGHNPGDPDETFSLSATAGEPIVFSGNTHNPGNAGATPNSIYFGNNSLIAFGGVDSQVTATFNVAAGGALHMWDPLASQPDDLSYVDPMLGPMPYANLALTITKTGPGTWVLAGVSDMHSATNWTVGAGTLHLVADAAGAPAHIKLANTTNKMAVADPASFTLKSGASLLVEPASAAHQISGRKITLESGSKVGVAGFKYGPVLDAGKHTVLTLNAANVSNQSGLTATSGDITIGVNTYKYSGLAWDGHNLVMTVGQGGQDPILAGVPAVTGGSHIGLYSVQGTLNTLGNRVAGAFRDLSGGSGVGTIPPAEDGNVEESEDVSAISSDAAPAAGEDAATRYRAADQPNRIWFTPYYASTNQSGAGNVGYDLDTPGVALGFERLLGDRAFAGLAFTVNWPTYSGGGTDIDATNFTLALYGGGILPWGELEVDGRVGYGWTDYDQTRRVAAPGVPQQRYDSDYDGQMFFAGLGLGRTFQLGQLGQGAFWLRPGASYDYIHLSTDGFDEGAGLLSLSVDDYDQDLHRVKAGLEAGWEAESGFTASAEVYYLGLYGDHEAETSGHFVADPVNGFDIIGNGLDENNLGLGAKIGLPLGPNWELGLGYDALIGDDAVTHQGNANVTFRF